MTLITAVSFVRSSNAQGSVELYYDNGVPFGAGGSGFSGVKFSLPAGVSSARILAIRYMWYATGDALIIHITGPNFAGGLTPPISRTSTAGMTGGWNTLDVYNRHLVVSGDFCVVAEKPSEGNGPIVDNGTNTGRSYWGNSMGSMTRVVYPLDTENYMIRVVIEPIAATPSPSPTSTPTIQPSPSQSPSPSSSSSQSPSPSPSPSSSPSPSPSPTISPTPTATPAMAIPPEATVAIAAVIIIIVIAAVALALRIRKK